MSRTVPPRRPECRKIYLSSRDDMIRLGIWEDGALREVLFQESGGDQGQMVEGVFVGRVTRVEPSLRAAFVNLLPGVTGFLPARDARRRMGEAEERAGPIERLCHEGEALVVQVTADAHGDKGPRVSTDITFASAHLVVSPTRRGAVISSRIHDKGERARLQALAEDLLKDHAGTGDAGCGLILRTQAVEATRETLARELNEAMTYWSAAFVSVKTAQPGTMLMPAPDAVDRVLKRFAASADEFVADDQVLFQRLQRHFEDRSGRRPVLRLESSRNVFEDAGLDDEIDVALAKRVTLPGGGWISIGQTDALTAIDVNSGAARRFGSAETLALRTNEEAASAAARQIRLRGLSGLFVIDFIEMKREVDRQAVRRLLIDELGLDPSPCRVGGFSEFGLLEFTRQRSGQPLHPCLIHRDDKNRENA